MKPCRARMVTSASLSFPSRSSLSPHISLTYLSSFLFFSFGIIPLMAFNSLPHSVGSEGSKRSETNPGNRNGTEKVASRYFLSLFRPWKKLTFLVEADTKCQEIPSFTREHCCCPSDCLCMRSQSVRSVSLLLCNAEMAFKETFTLESKKLSHPTTDETEKRRKNKETLIRSFSFLLSKVQLNLF